MATLPLWSGCCTRVSLLCCHHRWRPAPATPAVRPKKKHPAAAQSLGRSAAAETRMVHATLSRRPSAGARHAPPAACGRARRRHRSCCVRACAVAARASHQPRAPGAAVAPRVRMPLRSRAGRTPQRRWISATLACGAYLRARDGVQVRQATAGNSRRAQAGGPPATRQQ